MKVIGNGSVNVGKFTDIAEDVEIVFQNSSSVVSVGDYCHIGAGCRLIVNDGNVTVDDWTSIHQGCLILSKEGVKIGQHCWFGQHCVLDGTAGLVIGNSVRVGMYSQIWSHVAAGEQYDGCLLFGAKSVNIADNVWLVGSCVCAPGVTISKYVTALSQSNILKSIDEYQVVAGSPAKVKMNMPLYTHLSLHDKVDLLKQWLCDFCEKTNDKYSLKVMDDRLCIHDDIDSIDFFCSKADYDRYKYTNARNNKVAVLLTEKIYTKKFTHLERNLFKFLSDNKVRFLEDRE